MYCFQNKSLQQETFSVDSQGFYEDKRDVKYFSHSLWRTGEWFTEES